MLQYQNFEPVYKQTLFIDEKATWLNNLHLFHNS